MVRHVARSFFEWSVLLLLATGAAHGAVAQKDSRAKFQAVAPCSELVARARTRNIPLEQLDPQGEAGQLDTGDSVTALVTLFEKGNRRTQWLLYLEAAASTEGDKAAKSSPMVMYSCRGGKFEFASSPAPVTLRTLGPFDASEGKRRSSKAEEKNARFNLDKGFLSVGLDHAAAAIMRLRETKTKGSFWFRPTPFSESEIRDNRKRMGNLQLTSEEEHALAGTCPALMSYFGIIQQTEGLKDILFELVDLPSAWSMLRNRGITGGVGLRQEDFALDGGDAWGLPAGLPVYHVAAGLDLNGQRALNVTFVVTSPRPPLLACGGIVGLLAERPGDKNTYLTLRVISARRSVSNVTAPVSAE